MKNLERYLRALANKRRLTIMQFLKKERRATVGEIARAINLSVKSTSKHLLKLGAADLVDSDQQSINVWYKLAPPPKSVSSIISCL